MADASETGVTMCVKYVVKQFLEDEHYRMLHQALAQAWSKLNSLSAAMKLMELYGVVISPEEQERLQRLPEEHQISALVNKMPQQSNEQFQHFFLQLQLLVSTATRVRKGLEEGRAEIVEQALDDAESTGISPYILRMAIVQAGTDVSNLRYSYEAWVKDADIKMGRLVRGQEDAIAAQKKLAEAQSNLAQVQGSQNEKAKKVLMSLAAGSATAMRTGCFKAWVTFVKQQRVENEIYKDYSEAIEMATERLANFKAEQLTGVRKMMAKRGDGKVAELLQEVLAAWKEDVAYEKDMKANAENVAALDAKLKGMQRNQAESSKKVLSRMSGNNDQALVSLSFQAWQTFHTDYQRDKDHEDAVKKSEQQIQAFLKAKGDSAKKVMSSMGGGSDQALMRIHFDSWATYLKDLKQEAEMAAKLEEAQSQLRGFGDRSKKSAKSVMEKAKMHQDNMVLLVHWNAWRMDLFLERTLRFHHAKIDAKRSQLVKVQHMFRQFANELESGLRDGDSARDFGTNRSKRSLNKSDAGTVSLPDIHEKPRNAWA